MGIFGRIFNRTEHNDHIDTIDLTQGHLAEGTSPETLRPSGPFRKADPSTAAIVNAAALDGWFDTITDWSPDDVVLSSACRLKPVTHVVDRIECQPIAFSEDDLEIMLAKLEPASS